MGMTPELAVEILRASEQECWLKGWDKGAAVDYVYNLAYKWAVKALEKDPCEDAVSRQAAIGALNCEISGRIESDIDLCKYKREFQEFADMILKTQEKAIQALPSVTPTHSGWISVDNELPKEHVCDDGFVEPSVPVLVQLNNKAMKVSRYWGSRERYKDKPWIDMSYPTTLEVVAWMPLPEPYEEREGREE